MQNAQNASGGGSDLGVASRDGSAAHDQLPQLVGMAVRHVKVYVETCELGIREEVFDPLDRHCSVDMSTVATYFDELVPGAERSGLIRTPFSREINAGRFFQDLRVYKHTGVSGELAQTLAHNRVAVAAGQFVFMFNQVTKFGVVPSGYFTDTGTNVVPVLTGLGSNARKKLGLPAIFLEIVWNKPKLARWNVSFSHADWHTFHPGDVLVYSDAFLDYAQNLV